MTEALILIDIQNDYFPGGAMELVGMQDAATRAARVLARFRERDAPRLHIQHLSVRAGATFFVPGSDGVRIHDKVAPGPGEPVIQKHFPNSFRETPLLEALRELDVSKVLICGAMSHMCVDSTTRAAFDLGFGCRVVHDACATRDLVHQGRTVAAAQVHDAFMAALAVPYAGLVACDEVAPG